MFTHTNCMSLENIFTFVRIGCENSMKAILLANSFSFGGKSMRSLLFFVSLALSTAAVAGQAKSFNCQTVKILDEDAVMYFELEEGTTIQGVLSGKKRNIRVGSLGYSGEEMSVKGKSPNYTVSFVDSETGKWEFQIRYTTGAGYLKDANGETKVLANCVWQTGIDPFKQPDITLGQ